MNATNDTQTDPAWQPIKTAPRNASWVDVLMGDGTVQRAHWASDLSGEDQPPFEGWFVNRGTYFEGIPEPVAWRPCSGGQPTGTPVEAEKTCRTCRWARWERDKLGRIMPRQAGECTYPYVPPNVRCIVTTFYKTGIWFNDTKECAAHEPIMASRAESA